MLCSQINSKKKMETQREAHDVATVKRNNKWFSDIVNRLFDWNEEFELLSKPEIPSEDFDMKRDYDRIQAIVQEYCFVLFLIAKIQMFGVTSVITIRQVLKEDERQPRHENIKDTKTTVEKESNESIQKLLKDELDAIEELSFLLDDDIVTCNFSDFITPCTMNKDKHRYRLQALMEKADEMVFLLSVLENHMTKKMWTYRGMLMKARSITKPSSPSCVPESSDNNKRLKNDDDHDVSESSVSCE